MAGTFVMKKSEIGRVGKTTSGLRAEQKVRMVFAANLIPRPSGA
jgi:hypothetical protein